MTITVKTLIRSYLVKPLCRTAACVCWYLIDRLEASSVPPARDWLTSTHIGGLVTLLAAIVLGFGPVVLALWIATHLFWK